MRLVKVGSGFRKINLLISMPVVPWGSGTEVVRYSGVRSCSFRVSYRRTELTSTPCTPDFTWSTFPTVPLYFVLFCRINGWLDDWNTMFIRVILIILILVVTWFPLLSFLLKTTKQCFWINVPPYR